MNEVAPGLVTVFGGSGFVGSQVVQALARRGWRVRIACRRPDRAWKLQTSGTVGQLQSVRCDVNRPADVEAALREGAGEHLESVRLFDVYTGDQVGAGHKSLAFALRFRAPDRTLTAAEATAAKTAAVALAAERFEAELRE